MRTDRHRARVVAGEAAKVSELRRQWSDTTVGEDERPKVGVGAKETGDGVHGHEADTDTDGTEH